MTAEIVVGPFARAVVRRHARRLAAGSLEQRRDAEQELTRRLIAALRKYDPARGSADAYVAVVVERAAGLLRRERRAKKRTPTVPTAAPRAGPSSRPPPGDPTDLRLDVAAAMASLPADLAAVAERLMRSTVAQVARDLALPRSTLVRKVERLHGAFAAAGLAIYT